jgi:hypothetical protein
MTAPSWAALLAVLAIASSAGAVREFYQDAAFQELVSPTKTLILSALIFMHLFSRLF